jgi:hypothetical protein
VAQALLELASEHVRVERPGHTLGERRPGVREIERCGEALGEGPGIREAALGVVLQRADADLIERRGHLLRRAP